MTFYPTDRLALFIDGANLYSQAKALGFDIDYRKLLDEFRKRGVPLGWFGTTADKLPAYTQQMEAAYGADEARQIATDLADGFARRELFRLGEAALRNVHEAALRALR